ncbi:MAG: extracellular solute-binding protein [Oscillospiraceae bacterium]|nr:extracellular solute-binding protein [Oscillospiraceae bacterium]
MKKILALLLAAIMLFSLAACGGGETEKPVEQEQQTTVQADETPYNGEMPIVKPGDEPVTIEIALINDTGVTDYENNAYTKWLEEQTGLNLEFRLFMDNSNAATQVALMVASGERLPDVIWQVGGINKQQGETYGKDGYFLPLSEYFEKYAYHFRKAFELYFPDEPGLLEQVINRGEGADNLPMYAFPTMNKGSYSDALIQAWINREWLDKLGLEKPTTIEELYDVLVAFRDGDPNGNGKKDEIPMTGRVYGSYSATDPFNYITNAFTYYHDVQYFSVENGVLDAPFKSDEFREMLKFVHKLYQEGLVTEQSWTQSSQELKGIINPLEGAPYLGGVVFGSCESIFNRDSTALDVYEPLPPLKDHTGKGGYATTGFSNGYITFISSDCEHPVEAFKLLDFMCSPESYLRQRWGEYGVDWVYSEGGKTGNRGGEAKIKVLNPSVFYEQNAQSWHYDVGAVADESYWEYEVDFTDTDNWDTKLVNRCNEVYNYTMEAPQPKELFRFAIYSQADYDERSEFAKELTAYIRNSRAEFCTGILNPNSDSDWQTYLDGLDALQYDRWIELAQIGYNRIFE